MKKNINNIALASKEYFKDITFYSYKKNLIDLCNKYETTPEDLFSFIEKTDIEHEQSVARAIGKIFNTEEESLEFYHGFNDKAL
jgi:hypothetical protein